MRQANDLVVQVSGRPRGGTARVGLDAIRAAVEDADSRKALYDRFTFSQRFYRIDPWAERVAGRHADEFSPMSRSMELAHS